MGTLSFIIQVELKCNCKCPREAQGEYRDRTGEDNVNTEAKIGVMQLQSKEGWLPPEAGRGKDKFSPTASTGSMTLSTP